MRWCQFEDFNATFDGDCETVFEDMYEVRLVIT